MSIIIINPRKEEKIENIMKTGTIKKKIISNGTNCGLIEIKKAEIIRGGKKL